MRRCLLVVILLSLAFVPFSTASGGVIDSVTVIGNNEVGEGPVDINITLTGVGGASSSSVNWSATLLDIEGNVIDSDSGNSLVDDGVLSYVETTLGLAPLGYSNLSVIIEGDVGTPGQDQWIEYYTTIHRLRPLELALGNPTINSIDANGSSTGNMSLSDGDFGEILVPVINNGDIPWNGTLSMVIDSVTTQNKTINSTSDSTQVFSFYTAQLSEGIYNINLTLVDLLDDVANDNSMSFQFSVGPPPLPSIELNISRLVEPSPGAQINWNLSAQNFGEADFNGAIVCDFNGVLVFSENVSIQTSEKYNTSLGIQSKPGLLFCSTDFARTTVTINASDLVEIESAQFVGAGHNSPSILGGPWHAGDEITMSILLRNEGDIAGNAEFEVEIDGTIQTSIPIVLDSSKAGELSHAFTFSSSGDHVVNWSVNSPDGIVDSNLSGSVTIPVLKSQTLDVEIVEITTTESGFVVSWSAELSEGRDRAVLFNFGTITDSIKGDSIVEERVLLQGITYGSMNIGFQGGQSVFVSVSEMGWVSGFSSSLESQSEIPDSSISPSITANPFTQPRVPGFGNQVTVFYTLSYTGGGIVSDSQLIVTDSDGRLLSSESIDAFTGNSVDSSANIVWPKGDNVKIILTWHVGGKSVSDQIVVKSEVIEEKTESFTVPWGGILGGMVVGMVGIFAIRLKNNIPTSKDKKNKIKSKTKTLDEKVEVACPACERRLRVPSTYSGAVRCPECDTKFDVEGEEKPDKSEDLDDGNNELGSDDSSELWSESDNDILSCPKCTRKLRVPYDKRPAKARCPACETVFEARKK